MAINIGDILVTIIVFVIMIMFISLIVLFVKRVFSTKNQNQIINQKLDIILEKLEENKEAK